MDMSKTKIFPLIKKTKFFPIRMDNDLITPLIQNFPGKISIFPGKYSGLPLHTQKLCKIEVQPPVEKIRERLPGCKEMFLSTSSHETLVKMVLSSQPIYHLTVLPAQKWLIKRIDRLRRSFLWRRETLDKMIRITRHNQPRAFRRSHTTQMVVIPVKAKRQSMKQARSAM